MPMEFNSLDVAANNHNLESGDSSWFGTAADGVTAVAASAYYGAKNSVSFIGHAVTGDLENYQAEDTMQGLQNAGLDSAAGYYNEHSQGVDAIGMVVGSLIPGMAGVKAVQLASKSSKIMGQLGLSTSRLDTLRVEANQAAIAQQQIFNPLHGKTMKAVASGFGVNAVESLGFEIAALSTTIASPVYDNMTASDMVWNTITFGAVGGVVGGSFSAAKTYFGVRGAVNAEAALQIVPEVGTKFVNASDNIIRAKSTKASDTVITEETIRFTNADAGITPRLNAIIAKQTPDDTANTFGFAKDVVRFKELNAVDDVYQVLELSSGKIYESAKKLVGNIGDTISKSDNVFILPQRGMAVVRDAAGKELRTIAGKSNLAEATLEEAQVAWLVRAETPLDSIKGIASDDIPALERLVQEARLDVPVNGSLLSIDSATSLLRFKKQEALNKLMTAGNSPETAARILNMPETLKQGDALWKVPMSKDAFNKEMLEPRYAAIRYDVKDVEKDAAFSIFGKQAIHQAEIEAAENSRVRMEAANYALKNLGFGGVSDSLMDELSVKPMLQNVSKASDSAGFFSFANGAYGSATAWAQNVGRLVDTMTTGLKAKNLAAIEKPLQAIMKDEKLADELILVTSKLRLVDEHYVTVKGQQGFVRLDVAESMIDASGKKKIDAAIDAVRNPPVIQVSKEIREFLGIHSQVNLQSYRKTSSTLATGHSLWDVAKHEKHPELMPIYVPPVNTSLYKHFVLVRQAPDVLGESGHVSAIVAKDAADLSLKIERAKAMIVSRGDDPARYQFLTKTNTDDYFKAQGSYEYARGMNDSRVDSHLRKAGVLGEEHPILASETKGAAMNDLASEFVDFHSRMSARTVRDTIESQYAEVFNQLSAMGKGLLELEASKTANVTQAALEATKNPYADVIKTALNISNFNEFDKYGWVRANRIFEQVGSASMATIGKVCDDAVAIIKSKGKGLTVEQLDELTANANAVSARVGMPGGYLAAANSQYAEQIAARPMLSQAIARGNGIISMYALGLDAIQHINNIVGATVGQNAEMGSLLAAIAKKDPAVAGQLAYVDLKQAGLDGSVISSAKLLSSSIKRFFSGGQIWDDGGGVAAGRWRTATGKEIQDEYIAKGLTLTNLQQFRQTIDNLSFTGAESAAELNNRVFTAVENFGKFATDNKVGNFSALFTRFLAADAIRQITDHAMAQNLIKSGAEAETYWSTAVNRIQGNTVAAQRPAAFQGAIGQAIGLFMTYQVNLMQQLFRYAGNGDKVGTAMLLGTQGALYGMQGLPGWNFINSHIIADANGNLNHSDLYSTVSKAVPQEVAEWVLFGAGSNALGIFHPDLEFNLYTRGDINPRTLTIVPAAIDETIIYKSTAGFLKNFYDVYKNISGGAPVDQAFYQGLQHQGINRPLAGLGAILAGGSYTADGKLINPIESQLTSLDFGNAIRIAGAKPLDDAIAADALFRSGAYNAMDMKKRERLAESVRLDAADGSIDPDAWQEFAGQYARSGGKPEAFKKFVYEKLKDQEEGIVQRSVDRLRDPVAQNLIAIIGADEPNFEWNQRSDFALPPAESEHLLPQ